MDLNTNDLHICMSKYAYTVYKYNCSSHISFRMNYPAPEARDAPRPRKKQGWECPAPSVEELRIASLCLAMPLGHAIDAIPWLLFWAAKDWEDYKEWLQQQDSGIPYRVTNCHKLIHSMGTSFIMIPFSVGDHWILGRDNVSLEEN